MIDYLKNCVKNLDLEKYKDKLKPLGIAAVCFVAVFAAGFGVGQNSGNGGVAPATKRSDNTNYTTNTNAQAKTDAPPKEPEKSDTKTNSTNKPTTTNTNSTASAGECIIKGSKSKIYHVPGGSFYNRTSAAQCFGTEEEAQAAGYTKSSR